MTLLYLKIEPRKIDLEMASGEYFLSKDEKKIKKEAELNKQRQEKLNKKIQEKEKVYIAPKVFFFLSLSLSLSFSFYHPSFHLLFSTSSFFMNIHLLIFLGKRVQTKTRSKERKRQ